MTTTSSAEAHSARLYSAPVLTSPDLDLLISDTEAEILRVIERVQDERTHELYEMVRYHLGLDGDGPRGKRIRPLLGLLAYDSLTGHHAEALPGAAAVELGHNFSLVHDDIEDRDVERHHRATLWMVFGVAQGINTGDTLFTLSRMALYRLRELGFSDGKVLDLMRLYDETCLALCEGQFMDIWGAEHDDRLSVDFYFDMIGRKTAALIAASVQAGAMLATDDERIIDSYRGFGWSLGIAFQLNDDLLGIWATSRRPARNRRTWPSTRRRCRSSTRWNARRRTSRHDCASCWPRRSRRQSWSRKRDRSSSAAAGMNTRGRGRAR